MEQPHRYENIDDKFRQPLNYTLPLLQPPSAAISIRKPSPTTLSKTLTIAVAKATVIIIIIMVIVKEIIKNNIFSPIFFLHCLLFSFQNINHLMEFEFLPNYF